MARRHDAAGDGGRATPPARTPQKRATTPPSFRILEAGQTPRPGPRPSPRSSVRRGAVAVQGEEGCGSHNGCSANCPNPSFYEATGCQAPENRSDFETGSRRSGLLISPGARGGGASNDPDVRRRERLSLSVLRVTKPLTDHERLATCEYLRASSPSWLTGGPLESSLTLRLPSIRGHRRGIAGDAPAAAMRGTVGASRSIYRTVPSNRGPGSITSGSHQWVHARRGAANPYAFSVAPSGTTPCSTYRQSAMASFRARATMPMRLLRPPAAPTRR
jgi:hypothetical protein